MHIGGVFWAGAGAPLVPPLVPVCVSPVWSTPFGPALPISHFEQCISSPAAVQLFWVKHWLCASEAFAAVKSKRRFCASSSFVHHAWHE